METGLWDAIRVNEDDLVIVLSVVQRLLVALVSVNVHFVSL